MMKKLWRSTRCRLKYGYACPHVSTYHQTRRERARTSGRTRQLINS